ncbi:MAG: cation transporter [Deltaproteobacteria bacterium]|nr:cation transporter [Deltaproteobacteria bacterium]
MKQRKYLLAICLVSIMFLLIGSQPLFAAERIVKMVVLMECACAETVNRAGSAVKDIPGVLDYDVNGFTREVTVKFDDAKTNVENIMEGLTKRYFPIEGQPEIIK